MPSIAPRESRSGELYRGKVLYIAPKLDIAIERKGKVSVRLHSLDGLRAISILLVLLGHLNGTRNFGTFNFIAGDIAHLGVVVFFVISGFLITSLLAAESEKFGRISLKLFFARRALRIIPPSYAYLAVVAGLAAAGVIALHPYDLLHALTWTANYAPNRSWYVGHLWSLSVEEQFYLLWPFAFALAGTRKRMSIAVFVIALGPAARFAAWFALRGSPYQDQPMFPMVADSLAAGCILGLGRVWFESKQWYLALFRPLPSASLLVAVLAANRYADFMVVRILGMGAVNVILAVLIHRSVYCWRDPLGRLLNWKPLAFCGVLSYSLYIWQQLFLNRDSGAWLNAFPQNLGCAVGAALVSWIVLEKPLMSLRRRLHPD